MRCALAVTAVLLTGCGSSPRTRTDRLGELLSVPAVGRIYGRCSPVERRWTIRFVADANAGDEVTYRVGSARSHSLEIAPGQALTVRLAPNRSITHVPPDPVWRSPAQTLETTVPVVLDISQGTEIHIYRVQAKLAVDAAIGDTADCALVSTSLDATTYYPGGQPPS
jgi:hypothetical protein